MKNILHSQVIFVGAVLLWSAPLALCDNMPNNITQEQQCGLSNCHGLDAQCVINPPQACDSMYGMGDFCRQYIHCAIVDGKCQSTISSDFLKCRNCVEGCDDNKNSPMQAFDCENKCRKLFE